MYHLVSSKRWYHGAPLPFSLAPPPFHFKLYAKIHRFTTLLTKHHVPMMYSSILILVNTVLYMYITDGSIFTKFLFHLLDLIEHTQC